MSSIRAGTTAHSELSANAGKAYVSTSPFFSVFYTYSTYRDSNLVTRGLLTVTSANNATACPAGRVLALNGRKLTPGVNPMDFIITTVNGSQTATTPKFYVGVTDLVSGLNGFIDPSNPIFANYDKNRPVTDYLTDMNSLNIGLTAGQAALTTQNTGQGAKLNTVSSTVEPVLQLTNNTTAVNLGAAAAGRVQMFGQIGPGTAVTATFTINTTAVTANSIILLTITNGGITTASDIPQVTLGTVVGGTSFVVTAYSSVNTTVLPIIHFLIIN